MPPVSVYACIEMLFETLKAKAKELSGAIQQAEDAETALAAPVERCKPWERTKRKEQAEQRETRYRSIQRRLQHYMSLAALRLKLQNPCCRAFCSA